ncbi:GNAT family N-acetyltransferase [Mucilaginibacter sp.]|uniref:GNAT family N-acetyltransferase n=1 Tax=Mucilaginibacter sp. TaxID=1882438 RepID=UPI0032666A7D
MQRATPFHWCIVDTATNQITGTLGYYHGFANNTGELGFVLLPQYQGKGYMSKAILLAVKFGLDTFGLSRVVAITTKQNHKAVQLLTRLNFIKATELEDDEVEYAYQTLVSW